MAFTLSENGIRYSKFLKSVMLPFNEIRSIIITEDVFHEDLLKSYVEEWSNSMCTDYLDYLAEET